MNFADQLRKKAEDTHLENLRREQEEREALENLEKSMQEAEAKYYSDRYNAIASGSVITDFYTSFKDRLLASAERSYTDESKYLEGEFIFLPEEYEEKQAAYEQARSEANDTHEVQDQYYESMLPHKVFSKEECDSIEAQLSKLFSDDGLRYEFKRSEFYYRHWENTDGRWTVTSKKLSGYTLSFVVKWYPWDASKNISQSTKDSIRRLCTSLINKNVFPGLTTDSPKLLKNLGLVGADVYVCQDTTIFRSGREGFAITNDGFYWLKSGYVESRTFEQIADIKNSTLQHLLPSYGHDEENIMGSFLSEIQKLIRNELTVS